MTESGTINDPILIATYGKETLTKVQTMLTKCKKHGIKLVTAESLTAGGIAHLLTVLSGSSNMLDRGYVVYNNQAKIDMLGVSADDLKIHEAVSHPVAEQMVLGALAKSNAQIAVSVTGYSDASGDASRNIPGGTVFIGLASRKNITDKPKLVQVAEHHFSTDRTACRRETVEAAIDGLTKAIDQWIGQTPSTGCAGALIAASTPGAACGRGHA